MDCRHYSNSVRASFRRNSSNAIITASTTGPVSYDQSKDATSTLTRVRLWFSRALAPAAKGVDRCGRSQCRPLDHVDTIKFTHLLGLVLRHLRACLRQAGSYSYDRVLPSAHFTARPEYCSAPLLAAGRRVCHRQTFTGPLRMTKVVKVGQA